MQLLHNRISKRELKPRVCRNSAAHHVSLYKFLNNNRKLSATSLLKFQRAECFRAIYMGQKGSMRRLVARE